MNANAHSARNGPRRWFTTAIAIAGMIAGLASATGSPPLVNESVAVPKVGLLVNNKDSSGQKIQANTSPGANSASANQGNDANGQFDAANEFCTGAINSSPHTLAKLANAPNNGANNAVINSTQGFAFNTGASDSTFVATAVTTNMERIDTSPTAAVGRFIAAIDYARMNSEGGVCSGAVLATNAAADFSVEWTDLGYQATACTI